jgi:hypothetical protein
MFYNSVIPGAYSPGMTPFILGVLAQQFFGLSGNPFDEFGNILIPWADVSPTICAEPDSGIENI